MPIARQHISVPLDFFTSSVAVVVDKFDRAYFEHSCRKPKNGPGEMKEMGRNGMQCCVYT